MTHLTDPATDRAAGAATPTVYLDHAATTPIRPEAVEAMAAHLRRVGNPSSLHASGRWARRVVEESRETLARAVGCRPGEVGLYFLMPMLRPPRTVRSCRRA